MYMYGGLLSKFVPNIYSDKTLIMPTPDVSLYKVVLPCIWYN